eukprot:CAMPEP_0117677298 /NCGR_PEP_ID=MMETSP0804-20121206/16671_1 /TAXON_ID=1074897 /ORGANISM="Tetraselmis astigmatica, Strain CCMP880" /LENGTH=65 /DNA_ID=CAMNT_0005486573 /DNA_START=388 /DNA_END=584 /DNA_ORIENTATION=-
MYQPRRKAPQAYHAENSVSLKAFAAEQERDPNDQRPGEPGKGLQYNVEQRQYQRQQRSEVQVHVV